MDHLKCSWKFKEKFEQKVIPREVTKTEARMQESTGRRKKWRGWNKGEYKSGTLGRQKNQLVAKSKSLL